MKRSLCAALLLFIVACGSPAPGPSTPPAAGGSGDAGAPAPKPVAHAETPDAPFRLTPPPEDGELTVVPPKIESFKLGNGMRVLLLERHDLPLVTVRVVFKGGASDYAAITPGVGSFMGAMLEQGTTSRDAIQISDDYQEVGASHSVACGAGAATGQVSSLTKNIDKALAIMSDVLQHPAFPEPEIERLRAKRLTQITQEKNSAEAAAGNAVPAVLFGRQHAYGHMPIGRADEVKKLTKNDIIQAYGLVFNPKNATVVVVGDATRATISPKLEKAFGGWRPAKGTTAPKFPGPATPTNQRLFWVDRPNAPQSQVHIIDVGPSENTPDRIPLLVMNAILGGSFSSRINLNLREAHAYTYGARSRFVLRHGPGTFSTGGAMVAQHTAASAQEILKEISRMLAEDVKAAELADAKESIRRGVATPFETLNGSANALESLALYDRPLDFYATLPKKIDAVTVEDVRKAAKAHLHMDTLKVVVVGDRAKYQQSVVDALKIGNPALLDEWGDPVTK